MSPRSSANGIYTRNSPANANAPAIEISDGTNRDTTTNNNSNQDYRSSSKSHTYQRNSNQRNKSTATTTTTKDNNATNPAKDTAGAKMSGCPRTDFALLSMKGGMVKVRRNVGGEECLVEEITGIFDGLDFSRQLVQLSWAQQTSPSTTDSKPKADLMMAHQDIPLAEILAISLEPINYMEISASQTGSFATDTQISKAGGAIKERELFRWKGSDEEEDNGAPGMSSLKSLEEESTSKGHSGGSWDQFDANRRLFGIEPTFDESQYTTPIDRTSEQYERLAAEAERLAEEINRGSDGIHQGNIHMLEERTGVIIGDDDEEDRYGAVVRSATTTSGGGSQQDRREERPKEEDRKSDGKASPSRPVTFREAALRKSSNLPPVTMPKSVSSTLRPASGNSISSSPPPSSASPSTNEERKPRKSIANLTPVTDAKSLELAREEVEQATLTINRRMSQVAAEMDASSQQADKPKKETTVDANMEKTVSSEIPPLSSSNAMDTATNLPAKLNPNANDFVPSADSGMPVMTPPFVPQNTAFPYYNPYSMAYVPYYPGMPFYPSSSMMHSTSSYSIPSNYPHHHHPTMNTGMPGGRIAPVTGSTNFNPYATNFYYNPPSMPPASTSPTMPPSSITVNSDEEGGDVQSTTN